MGPALALSLYRVLAPSAPLRARVPGAAGGLRDALLAGEADLGLGRERRPGTAPPLGRLVLWGRGPGSPRGGVGVADFPVPTSRGKPMAAPLALNLISAPQISFRALLLFGYLHYRSPTEFEHF